MNIRRTTFIALRILALYLGIRGIEFVVTTSRFLEFGFPVSPTYWFDFGASLVPVVAAIVVWVKAESLSIKFANVRPLTPSEVDAALASEGPDDQEPSERGMTDEARRVLTRDPLIVAVAVLGVYFIVQGIRGLSFNVPAFIIHASPECSATPASLRNGACPFWSFSTVREALDGVADIVTIVLGTWLIARPYAISERIERWRQRRGRAEQQATTQ